MGNLFPLLFIGGIGLAVVGLGIVFYLRAVASRKVYNCPQCGEVVRVELMRASHCNHCGAPLRISETNDAQS